MCSIKRFLQQNQFPIYLINRIIKNFLDRQYSTINKLQNVPKLPVLILLPYLGVYSVRLKKNLNKFLGKIYPHIEFKFVFQPAKRIGSSFPFKDRARVTFALLLFTSFLVVAVRLRITVRHHAILLLDAEST